MSERAADAAESPASVVAQLDLLKALAHETRLQILGILSYRDLSPAELARQRAEPVSKVAYHFRFLEELGCAEVVRTRQVRGSVEHFYRRTGFVVYDDDDWSRLPAEVQDVITASIVKDLFGRITRAMRAGTFNERDDHHLTWTPVRLDEPGWEEMTELLMRTLDAVAAIEERAADRLEAGGGASLLATVALAGFESPAD